MKYVNKPYVKKGKLYLGSGKKQRRRFIPLLGIAAKLLPVLSTALSLLGKGKKKGGEEEGNLEEG